MLHGFHIFTIIRLFKKHNLNPIKKVRHDIDGHHKQMPLYDNNGFGNDLTKGILPCTGQSSEAKKQFTDITKASSSILKHLLAKHFRKE